MSTVTPTPTSAVGRNSHAKKLLYVDAANYTGDFFRVYDRWSLTSAKSFVEKFCRAASFSGWTLVVFLDQAALTKEAQEKWRKRREREIRKGERRVPQGALRLVGDMFAAQGVPVHYSSGADCDDTIAFWAQADGASVLSSDRDFLRYTGATFSLYKNYTISKGKNKALRLIPQEGTRHTSRREIGPKPKTEQCDPFRDCVEQGTYLRGSPSPLVQEGNLHIRVRSLRAALYAHLNIKLVEEEFPTRVGDACVWDKQVVVADPTMNHLLFAPKQALEQFSEPRPAGSSDEDWIKHQFALRSILAEICCTATRATLLDTLLPLTRNMEIPPRKQKGRKKKRGNQIKNQEQSQKLERQNPKIKEQQPQTKDKPQQIPAGNHNNMKGGNGNFDGRDKKKKGYNRRQDKRLQNQQDESTVTNQPLAINAKNRWTRRMDRRCDNQETEEERDARLVRRLLNKLTPSNFEKVVPVFVAESTFHHSEERLKKGIAMIVERAASDRRYVGVYAQLCEALTVGFHVAELNSTMPQVISFGEALLQNCRENLHPTLVITKGVLPVADHVKEEKEVQIMLMRHQYIGTSRFVGELYNNNVFGLAEIVTFVEELLWQVEHIQNQSMEPVGRDDPQTVDQHKLALEGLCGLLETCGHMLDKATLQSEPMCSCWNVLKQLVAEVEADVAPQDVNHQEILSFRMKHMVQELLELRSAGWHPVRHHARQRKDMVAKPLDDFWEVEKAQSLGDSNTQRRVSRKPKVRFQAHPSTS